MPLFFVHTSQEGEFKKFIFEAFSGMDVKGIDYKFLNENPRDPPPAEVVWFRFPESDQELLLLTRVTWAWMQEGQIIHAFGVGADRERVRAPKLAGYTNPWASGGHREWIKK